MPCDVIRWIYGVSTYSFRVVSFVYVFVKGLRFVDILSHLVYGIPFATSFVKLDPRALFQIH